MEFNNSFYMKNLIKKPWLYLAFIAVGVSLFLWLTLTNEVAVLDSYTGTYADDRLIINEVIDYPISKIYIYKNRSNGVYVYNTENSEIIDDSYTILYINKNATSNSLSGVVYIEVEKQYTSLLSIILRTESRYVQK